MVASSKSSESGSNAIYWFRQDLRLSDNPALVKSIEWAKTHGGTVIPVYIWAPDEEGEWPPGGASRVWLHHSLSALQNDLQKQGSELYFFEGSSSESFLHKLCEIEKAGAVFWNRRYEPAVIERDKQIKAGLKEKGIVVETFNGALLQEPWQLSTKEGKPYQVFTPFWKTCLAQLDLDPPLKRPAALPSAQQLCKSASPVPLETLQLLPKIHWDSGIVETWKIGEKAAHNQLKIFLHASLEDYPDDRNRPDYEGVSRLSPHLHFGEISPRQVWYAVKDKVNGQSTQKTVRAAGSYLRELGWREFSHHLLYHFPETPVQPLRAEFRHFPWENSSDQLKAWQKGLTGYPIVDAGMRELWHTGIMHNRVRMIAASFLIKDLRLSWVAGARWFWDTLIDADLAQNTMGWQWTAGCGADAAPYFRVFNPVLQGEKFDPDGDYVRKWVPELKNLSPKDIHKPWLANQVTLQEAGVVLGKDYPRPLVDHAEARQKALAAFQHLKELRVTSK